MANIPTCTHSHMELRPGDLVQLQGLKLVELNGTEGKLFRLDPNGGRWEVKLLTGEMKSVQPANLVFRGVGPIEDDGTLALIGLATDNDVVHKVLKHIENELRQANESAQLVSHVISTTGGWGADGKDAHIWFKLAQQAERRVRGVVEDLQKNLEEVDSIVLGSLNQVTAQLKMAKKDLIRFVQATQESLEATLQRLQPVLKHLSSLLQPAKKHGWSKEDDVDATPLREKYQAAFEKAAANNAMCDQQPKEHFGLKPITVKYQGKGEKPAPSDNLYVKGLPGWVTEEDIKAIFSKVGDVQSMRLKTADWGAIAFVRVSNRKEAAAAIQQFNDTVPAVLVDRAAAEESRKLRESEARAVFSQVVEQLEKGRIIVVDITRPLGLFFNDNLLVNGVQDGSQAVELGLAKGWRVRSVGGTNLETTKDLVAKIQSLKASGFKEAAVVFTPAPVTAVFDSRPMGLSLLRDKDLGLFFVTEATGLAVEQGIRPGAVLTRAGGRDPAEMSDEEVMELMGDATLPLRFIFEQIPDIPKQQQQQQEQKQEQHSQPPVVDLENEEEKHGKVDHKSSNFRESAAVSFPISLSQPLGIFFDDKLVVREVGGGSQAATLGITKGWQAISISIEAVRTTQELVANLRELKAAGIEKVTVTFLPADCDDRTGALRETRHRATTVQETPSPKLEDHGSFQIVQTHVDLTESLGVFFDDELVVKSVQQGSQAAEKGICTGWRVKTVGDTPVRATQELVTKIKQLRDQNVRNVVITCETCAKDPSSADARHAEEVDTTLSQHVKESVTFARDPEGESAGNNDVDMPEASTKSIQPAPSNMEVKSVDIDFRKPLGIFFDDLLTVREVQSGSQAEERGVCKDWKALSLNSEPLQSTKDLVTKVQALKSKGVQEAVLQFAVVEGSEMATSPKRAADPGEVRKDLRQPEFKDVNIDLNKPLGIFFDDFLTIRGVQNGSQAEEQGVCKEWKALSISSEPLQATKDLVAKVQALKNKGVQKAVLRLAMLEGSEVIAKTKEVEDFEGEGRATKRHRTQ